MKSKLTQPIMKGLCFQLRKLIGKYFIKEKQPSRILLSVWFVRSESILTATKIKVFSERVTVNRHGQLRYVSSVVMKLCNAGFVTLTL